MSASDRTRLLYDLDHVLRNCASRAALASDPVALPDPITVRDAMEKLEMHFGRDAARGPRDLEAFLEAAKMGIVAQTASASRWSC